MPHLAISRIPTQRAKITHKNRFVKYIGIKLPKISKEQLKAVLYEISTQFTPTPLFQVVYL